MPLHKSSFDEGLESVLGTRARVLLALFGTSLLEILELCVCVCLRACVCVSV
jgi:hypothetical protein